MELNNLTDNFDIDKSIYLIKEIAKTKQNLAESNFSITPPIHILLITPTDFSNSITRMLFYAHPDCTLKLFTNYIHYSRLFDIIFPDYWLHNTNGINLAKRLLWLCPQVKKEVLYAAQ